jgi:hypothetical protein
VRKNVRGAASAPARIALTGRETNAELLPPFDVQLPVSESVLNCVRLGDMVRIEDSRKRARKLTVVHIADHACICVCSRSGYLSGRAALSVEREGEQIESGHVGVLPFFEEPIRLNVH